MKLHLFYCKDLYTYLGWCPAINLIYFNRLTHNVDVKNVCKSLQDHGLNCQQCYMAQLNACTWNDSSRRLGKKEEKQPTLDIISYKTYFWSGYRRNRMEGVVFPWEIHLWPNLSSNSPSSSISYNLHLALLSHTSNTILPLQISCCCCYVTKEAGDGSYFFLIFCGVK